MCVFFRTYEMERKLHSTQICQSLILKEVFETGPVTCLCFHDPKSCTFLGVIDKDIYTQKALRDKCPSRGLQLLQGRWIVRTHRYMREGGPSLQLRIQKTRQQFWARFLQTFNYYFRGQICFYHVTHATLSFLLRDFLPNRRSREL